jgi:hypothetical protein
LFEYEKGFELMNVDQELGDWGLFNLFIKEENTESEG